MREVQLSIKELNKVSHVSPTAHASVINALAIDDMWLYSIGNDGNLLIWSKDTLQHHNTLRVCDSNLLSLKSDERHLYVGTAVEDGKIWIWLRETHAPVLSLENDYSSILGLACTDNNIIAARSSGPIDFWRKGDWMKTASIPSRHYIPLCVEADGQYLYAGGIDDFVSVFDKSSLSHLTNLEGHNSDVFSLAFDEEYLYSGSGEVWWGGPGSPRPPEFESAIRVWKKGSWECTQVLRGHSDNVNSIMVDRNAVYSVSDDGSLRVYDKVDWSQSIADWHVGPLKSLAIDETHVFIAGNDGRIRRVPKELLMG